jgi:hypothetical protein
LENGKPSSILEMSTKTIINLINIKLALGQSL